MSFEKYLPGILFALMLFFSQPVLTQSGRPTDTASAEECIIKLKETAMIVRLNMKKRTRDAYLQQIKRPGISNKDSLAIAMKIETLDINRQLYKLLVKQAFSKYYKFSDVYFIDNHMCKQLIVGGVTELETSGHEIITSDQITDYYVLTNGFNDHNWILKQADLSDMPIGFPDEYNSGFKRVVNWVAKKSNLNDKDMNNVAIKINERLFKYYNKIKKEY